MGESGSGKSTSLRNFEPYEIGIFNVANKPLPFKKKLSVINNATYSVIEKKLVNNKSDLKAFAIDDSQYLIAFELFNRAKEKGYDKFTDMAVNFYNLIQYVIRSTPPDVIVYFLHHVDTNGDKAKAKTAGKMLDEKLTVEGLFSIVLYCVADDEGHRFITQSEGISTAKSPMDMFPPTIGNDLKLVDTTIREYYELNAQRQEESQNAEA